MKLRKLHLIFLSIFLVSCATQTVSTDAPIVEEVLECESASIEDIENINSGMNESSFSIAKAFVDKLEASEIEEVQKIFPNYGNLVIIAGQIDGVPTEANVGIWFIQRLEGGSRILALDPNARNYSQFGADVTDDSRSGILRALLYEFSFKTNVSQCVNSN